jgi:hypothetical protein
MSAFGGKADIIQGKADIEKCPLMTQSGHALRQLPALELEEVKTNLVSIINKFMHHLSRSRK